MTLATKVRKPAWMLETRPTTLPATAKVVYRRMPSYELQDHWRRSKHGFIIERTEFNRKSHGGGSIAGIDRYEM